MTVAAVYHRALRTPGRKRRPYEAQIDPAGPSPLTLDGVVAGALRRRRAGVTPYVLLAAFGVVLTFVVGILLIVTRFRRMPRADQALVIGRMGRESVVSFDGALVLPGLQQAETLDLSVVTIDISLAGTHAVRCRDRIRLDVEATLPVRVNRTTEDVLKVATLMGCARASDPEEVRMLYRPRLESAVRTVLAEVDADEASSQRERIEEAVAAAIDAELDGFVHGAVALSRMSLVPIERLDPDDPLDAEAIAELTRRAALAAAATYEERRRMAVQQREADLAILELERATAEARARQEREIAIMQAREQGELDRVRLEEESKTLAVRVGALAGLAEQEKAVRAMLDEIVAARRRQCS